MELVKGAELCQARKREEELRTANLEMRFQIADYMTVIKGVAERYGEIKVRQGSSEAVG